MRLRLPPNFVRSAYRALGAIRKTLVPRYLRVRISAEEYSNERFAREVGERVAQGAVLLDAGAGLCPYEHLFSHASYFSTDVQNVHDNRGEPLHEFLSNVDHLPLRAGWADVVTAFQVLEHVPEPEAALRELYRILRPGGTLYLTVPQGWGLHLEPHHYFNFTRYGLEYLLTKVGFVEVEVKERGGIFWLLGNRLKTLPYYIVFQYVYPLTRPRLPLRNLSRSTPLNVTMALLLFPVYLVALPLLGFLIPLLFFYLDRLDRRRLFCLGYACSAEKPPSDAGRARDGRETPQMTSR